MSVSKYYRVYEIETKTIVEDISSISGETYMTADVLLNPYWVTGLYETEEDAIMDLDRYVGNYDNTCFVVLPVYVKEGIYS